MVDSAGQPVWFAPITQHTANLQVQQYRGEPVLTWWQGELIIPAGFGRGKYLLVDTSYREVTTVNAGRGLHGDLHDFLLTHEGTALFTAYQVVPFDLSPIGGPRHGQLLESYLQEVDVASGKVLFEWRASSHVDLTESYQPLGKTAKEREQPYDFFHINSIDVDTDGNLIVSSRHCWAVYKVDRSSGAVLWRLHGKRSDFTMGPGADFSWQHHVRHHGQNVLSIFDDGAGTYKVEPRSRGITLTLDYSKRQASLLHEYLPEPSVVSFSQGSCQLLPDGHVFVGWGSEPYYSEYTEGGELLYVAQLPNGTQSYRAFRSQWVARPISRPAIAADRDTNQVTVYASWNGATEVESWEVVAGPSSSLLSSAGTFVKNGFETAMTVKTSHNHVAARARDRQGRVLGQSGIVQV